MLNKYSEKTMIFLAGHHRSGTSMMHEILRKHKAISGFSGTGFPEDEGQFLQDVYPIAKKFGGPGKYIFDDRSYMNENHVLSKQESANKIMDKWANYYDMSCECLIEKSPPNIVKTRFLQSIFPKSKFVVILRHPIAVAYATQKWSRTSIKSLIDHSLKGYEIFQKDLEYLDSAYVVRYEDFVNSPQETVDSICSYLELENLHVQHNILSNVNDKYFNMWKNDRESWLKGMFFKVPDDLELRAKKFGYSLRDPKQIGGEENIIGLHGK